MSLIASLQDRAAAIIGVTPDDRRTVIEAMLRRSTADVVGYWLQLALSMGIATLGLAMGSTAVVIGAMLISPLMGPLIELGAGLATGSLILSFRAGVRTAGSVAVVVLGAAGVTRMLPFHEITTELAARTSPTILDLFVAVFCALAAVYTTVRQGKDVVSAAAGTAIGISLVPPLCTAGYGLGVWNQEVFRGALLLFTANFAAIAAVTSIALLGMGYGQVRFGDLEGELLAAPADRRLSHRAARLTRRAVGKRLGVMRLLIPAILLGAILVPLMRALEEVSWQVRVRTEVEAVLASVPGAVVRQSLDVRAGVVRVRMLIVGSDADARAVAEDLRQQIAVISGSEPALEVIAVPDAAALDAMASQLRAVSAPAVPAAVMQPDEPAAATFARALELAVAERWPAAAGPALRIRTTVTARAPVGLAIEVTHLGPPVGAAGEQLLEDAWRRELDVEIDVIDRAIPVDAIEAAADAAPRWLPEVARVLATTDGLRGLQLCMTVPGPPPAPPATPRRRGATPPTPPRDPHADDRAVLDGLIGARPDVTVTLGERWRLTVGDEPCRIEPPTPTP